MRLYEIHKLGTDLDGMIIWKPIRMQGKIYRCLEKHKTFKIAEVLSIMYGYGKFRVVSV